MFTTRLKYMIIISDFYTNATKNNAELPAQVSPLADMPFKKAGQIYNL